MLREPRKILRTAFLLGLTLAAYLGTVAQASAAIQVPDAPFTSAPGYGLVDDPSRPFSVLSSNGGATTQIRVGDIFPGTTHRVEAVNIFQYSSGRTGYDFLYTDASGNTRIIARGEDQSATGINNSMDTLRYVTVDANGQQVFTNQVVRNGEAVTDQQMADEDRAQEAARNRSQGEAPSCDWGTFFSNKLLPICILQPLGYGILKAAGYLLYFTGMILNFTVDYLVNGMGEIYQNNLKDGVESAWEIFRNIGNALFIFILLYAAFNTVLGRPDGLNLVPRIIVVALLMNFSLLFAQTVIDVSNRMAGETYKLLAEASSKEKGNKDGVAGAFIAQTKLSSAYSSSQLNIDVEGQGSPVDSARPTAELNGYNYFIYALFSSAFLLALAVYFLVLAVMLVSRFVVLIILMIVSVLAFLAYLLPATQKHAMEWWSTLIGQSFFAPAVFLMLVATLKVQGGVAAQTEAAGGGGNFTDLFTQGTGFGMIVSFLILLGLLVASIVLGKKLSEWGSKQIIGVGKSATKFAVGAAAGMAGSSMRSTLGRAGAGLANNETLKRLSQSDSLLARTMGRTLRGTAKAAGTSSFDFRKSRVAGIVGEHSGVNFGEGVKGSAEKGWKGIAKEREEKAKKAVAEVAANDDLKESEKRERIEAALDPNKSKGRRAKELRRQKADHDAAIARATTDMAAVEARINQHQAAINSSTGGYNPTAQAALEAAKREKVAIENRTKQAKEAWRGAQNKHLFGHEEANNYSSAYARVQKRASLRDHAAHWGGALTVVGGLATGGAGFAVAGAVAALGGGRAVRTMIRAARGGGIRNAMGDEHYQRGLQRGVEASDKVQKRVDRIAALRDKRKQHLDNPGNPAYQNLTTDEDRELEKLEKAQEKHEEREERQRSSGSGNSGGSGGGGGH